MSEKDKDKDKEKTPSPDESTGQGEPKIIDITLPTGGDKKTRKPRKKKDETGVVKEADPILKQNIYTLVDVINSLASVRLGNFWRFSEAEMNAIADPATRICERAGLGEFAGKYTDFFMLATALVMPIAVRGLILVNAKKQGGGEAFGQPERKVPESANTDSVKTSDNGSNVIDDRLPAITDGY
jgi:hypothetical protein